MATERMSVDPPSRILIAGYDGSDHGAAAVHWAAGHLDAGGRLVVVFARHPGVPAASPARLQHAATALDALWKVEDALGDIDVELVHAENTPARAMCRVAAECNADGIVVGQHHEGPFNADTVSQLLQLADRPVTVVPTEKA